VGFDCHRARRQMRGWVGMQDNTLASEEALAEWKLTASRIAMISGTVRPWRRGVAAEMACEEPCAIACRKQVEFVRADQSQGRTIVGDR